MDPSVHKHVLKPLLVTLLPIALAALHSASAQSAWPAGAYLELRGGASFLEDSDVTGAGLPRGTEAELDVGYSVSGALGYGFAHQARYGRGEWNHWRIELEGLHAESDHDEIDIGGAAVSLGGETTATGALFNVYRDFNLSAHDPRLKGWRPYVGAGVGGVVIDVEADVTGVGLVDDRDAVLAYQVRAGLAYEVSPRLAATLGYRFFDTLDPELDALGGGELETEYRSHSVELGLRYRF